MNRENRVCRDKSGSSIFGIVLVGAGALILAKKLDLGVPDWLLSWPMIPLVVGIVLGIRHKFQGTGWLWPLLVGVFFLADEILPDFMPREYLLPVGLVLVGLFFIFRPNRQNGWGNIGRKFQQGNTRGQGIGGETGPAGEPGSGGPAGFGSNESSTLSDTDVLNETAIFGNLRRSQVSKNFAGGEVSAVFGSAEISLTQADFTGQPRLELNAIFGSIRLVVPSHWQLKIESSAVLGGIEDKRPKHSIYSDKILVLEANAIFGGIQIESY